MPGRRSGEYIGFHSCEFKRVTTIVLNHPNPKAPGVLEQRIDGRRWGQSANPQFVGAEVAQHGMHPTDVIGVAMGDCNHVEVGDSPRPQVGRDYVLAIVEFSVLTTGGTAGVDQQGFAVWRDEKYGVPLADQSDGRQAYDPVTMPAP